MIQMIKYTGLASECPECHQLNYCFSRERALERGNGWKCGSCGYMPYVGPLYDLRKHEGHI